VLSVQDRTEVFLILREAVLNAVRHARAGTIEVMVDLGETQLAATVEDDAEAAWGAPLDGAGSTAPA
jgi:signal transduction histidine kinase